MSEQPSTRNWSDASSRPRATRHRATELDAAARQWQESGWALIEGLVAGDRVEQALTELKTSLRADPGGPSRPSELRVERPGDRGPTDGAAFRSSQFDGTTLFPISDCPTLNRLFVDEPLVRFAAKALRTDDIRIYQSRIWSKHGDHTNYEQPMHSDGNHALIPIVNEPEWWHLECFVYLHDVDEGNGATGLVPGSVARAAATDRGSRWPDVAPELYEAEVLAAASAGSVLAYRSDIWHRGHDLAPGTERHVMVVSFRPTTAEWIGFDAHARLVNRPDWVRFAEASTPEELALFGVPEPGHRYWTTDLLDGMAVIYPALDLQPWRDRLC